jgi:diguanylate cyclase (GGDEF)-like protein/PAS domain S-box-containing protein
MTQSVPTTDSDTPKLPTPLRLRRFLVIGLACLNLLVFILAGDSLYHSRLLYERRAEALTQSIAGAVDQNVSSSIEKIDLALRTVADELERQLAGKGIDEVAMAAFLAKQEERLPEVEAFRVANADGLVILGKGLNKQARTSWADRDYFIYHRDHTDRIPQISKPVIGRVAKKYIVGFAQRYNHPDGRFAGVISTPIAVDHFYKILSQFDLGPKGTLNLRDENLGLITRFPAIPDKPAGQIGNNTVSRELRQIFETGQQVTTYVTAASADGFERISTFRRLSTVPMMVLVGVAKEDYLSGWTGEAYRTVGMASGFLALSIMLGGFLLRLLSQAERDELQLRHAKAIVDSTDDAVISKTLAGIIKSWNAGAENLFGYTAEETIGQSMKILIPPGRLNEEPEILARIAEGRRVEHFETVRCCKDGRLIDISMTISPVFDETGKVIGASNIARDITQRKHFEESEREAKQLLEAQLGEIQALQKMLQEQVLRDPLTGIYNRRYLDESVPRELSLAKREGYSLTIVMLDLDHFKRVNDTYGHAAGDEVLRALTTILTEKGRESDIISRYGGEEFVVALPKMTPVQAFQRVEEWRHELAKRPVKHGDLVIRVTFSAGIAGFPDHGSDLDTLLANADEALYRSKNEGRNRVTCFEAAA